MEHCACAGGRWKIWLTSASRLYGFPLWPTVFSTSWLIFLSFVLFFNGMSLRGINTNTLRMHIHLRHFNTYARTSFERSDDFFNFLIRKWYKLHFCYYKGLIKSQLFVRTEPYASWSRMPCRIVHNARAILMHEARVCPVLAVNNEN